MAVDLTYLQAYYNMDDAANGDRVDSHGSYDLTDATAGIALASAAGPNSNDVADLDGAGEHLDSTNAVFACDDEDMAVCVWARRNGGSSEFLFSKYAGGDREWYLRLNSGVFNFYVSPVAGGTGATNLYGDAFTDTTWKFVVAWHDHGTEIGLQVDNAADDVAAHTGGIHAGSNDFTFGALPGGSSSLQVRLCYAGFFKGGFPDGTERDELYNSGSGLDYAALSGGGSVSVALLRRRGRCMKPAEYREWRKAYIAKCADLEAAKRRDRMSFKPRKRWQLDERTGIYLPPSNGIVTPRLFLGRAA